MAIEFETGSGRSQEATFDAIVVGSGISGGWAAKELCEQGVKTLLLERGRDVRHIRDYPTANLHPWEVGNAAQHTEEHIRLNPIQSRWSDATTSQFFVSDAEHPYVQVSPFHWIRGYHVGGRSLTWARQSYRWSDLDLEANAREGIGVDWPIRYADLAPWYAHVERFAGISGRKEGLPQLPDGEFLPPMDMTCVEEHFRDRMRERFGRCVTIGRTANLTAPIEDRGPCMNRNLCSRGCPFGGYFSSNSATLPAAQRTGNLTLRPHSIVTEIIYDPSTRRASGVRILDALTLESREYFARIIFLNASTIATTAILLNSTSPSFPTGLGNSSDQLGRNLMDHHGHVGATGRHEGFRDKYYSGRRANAIYIPRFRNLGTGDQRTDYLRGYAFQGGSEREGWRDRGRTLPGFGAAFKQALTEPGDWKIWLRGFGETLPDPKNRVTLDPTLKDKWGMPQVRIDFNYGPNEMAMRKDMKESALEMLEASGFTEVDGYDATPVGGDVIHEMGTARMGHDPTTSVLNRWNQMHDVPNVYITDGSCMTSSACQNPSLTYMALTARACHHAVEQLKSGAL